VLKESAVRMVSAMRSYDCVGRYGGEEFLIVVPDSELHDIYKQAERIRLAIQAEPIMFQNQAVSVTTSLGITDNRFGKQGSLEKIIENADKALYQAKRNGRNQVVCYESMNCIRMD